MATIDTTTETAAQQFAGSELRHAGMLGFGCALPSKVVSSAEIAERYGLTADWIIERTGVESRRVLDLEKGETLLSLVAPAARDALAVAGRDASEIDTVIVATVSPDNVFPAQALTLADAIGVPNNAVVFDLSAACTGFVTALGHAASVVEARRSNLALVVGAEALSRITPYDDPRPRRCLAMARAPSWSVRSSPVGSARWSAVSTTNTAFSTRTPRITTSSACVVARRTSTRWHG